MMTVDWSRWMSLTAEQQAALWKAYRDKVKDESDSARATNYRRMERAMAEAGRGS